MNISAPLISIVIPTYNRAYTIERTINSVLNQTYSNFEIIIIDDASTDNTENIITSIKDSRVKYMKLNQNSMGRKPRNLGINMSQGEYIAFLDSDDEWFPDKLEKQVRFIESNKGKNSDCLCFTNLTTKNGKSEKINKNSSFRKETDIMDYIFVGNNRVQTSTFMVSSSIAKQTLFDPQLKKHQDWDFCLRLKQNKAEFMFLNENLTIWHNGTREDRISNKYKNKDLSVNWFNNNKKFLSEKAQWGFKVKVLVEYLIENGEKEEAKKILLTSYKYNGINRYSLLKKLIKIYLPKSIINSFRN